MFGVTADVPFEPSTVRRRALAAWGWTTGRNPDAHGPKRITVKARADALERIGLHEARHTFASLMIAAGVNAKALSTIMGHASIAITFDTYGHLMPRGEDEARAHRRIPGPDRRRRTAPARRRGVTHAARASLAPVAPRFDRIPADSTGSTDRPSPAP